MKYIIIIGRERSSGPNIHDTEKIGMTKNTDGKVKKSLLIETVATVTTRIKQKSGSKDGEISYETRRKRTKK